MSELPAAALDFPGREGASYASRPEASRGRLHPEPDAPTRSVFQRDRDRIIHSAAFRRLKYKTQVFVYHEGDNFRTRLTHSLEVSQIARSVARVLGLTEDLAEALALAHDLGHPPFGHAGEEALHVCMKDFGGFDHNAQTLRILTSLEHRYAEFDGLNLTWETLEGVVKHNGPLLRRSGGPAIRKEGALPRAIAEYNTRHDLELSSFSGGEAQIAAIADDIAYNNHDIDDGLHAGLFSVDDLMDVPLAGPVFKTVLTKYPGLERNRLIHESVRRMINIMVDDLIAETRRRLAAARPRTVDDIRALDAPVVAFSEGMRANDKALKEFLFERMYRHYKVNRMTTKARRVVRDLFGLLLEEPGCLPTEWQQQTDRPGTQKTAIVVADYIGGMTDRFALQEHRRLFDVDMKAD